jgi:hypothetical protein
MSFRGTLDNYTRAVIREEQLREQEAAEERLHRRPRLNPHERRPVSPVAHIPSTPLAATQSSYNYSSNSNSSRSWKNNAALILRMNRNFRGILELLDLVLLISRDLRQPLDPKNQLPQDPVHMMMIWPDLQMPLDLQLLDLVLDCMMMIIPLPLAALIPNIQTHTANLQVHQPDLLKTLIIMHALLTNMLMDLNKDILIPDRLHLVKTNPRLHMAIFSPLDRKPPTVNIMNTKILIIRLNNSSPMSPM